MNKHVLTFVSPKVNREQILDELRAIAKVDDVVQRIGGKWEVSVLGEATPSDIKAIREVIKNHVPSSNYTPAVDVGFIKKFLRDPNPSLGDVTRALRAVIIKLKAHQ